MLVTFKLLINRDELFEKLFKLLNKVVEVTFKLLINRDELFEKLFKLLKKFIELTFKEKIETPEETISPTTFNVDKIVVLFKVLEPVIMSDDKIDILLQYISSASILSKPVAFITSIIIYI